MEDAVKAFIEQFAHCILRHDEHEAKDMDGEMFPESFSKTADSAGSLDGWHPKEMALFSTKICEHIPTMLKQIEEGAPWPRSTMHARVVYLEREGAAVGEVMSYRPFTITAPLCTWWDTMRLRSME